MKMPSEHTGIELGRSSTDSTGRRVDYLASPGTQYLNPLFSADFSALQNLNDTDIRGQGYSYEGTALTPGQSLGQHTSYLGSDIVGTMTTNRDSGNDVIYAGAGDDVVNAMLFIALCEAKTIAKATFTSVSCVSWSRKIRLKPLGCERHFVNLFSCRRMHGRRCTGSLSGWQKAFRIASLKDSGFRRQRKTATTAAIAATAFTRALQCRSTSPAVGVITQATPGESESICHINQSKSV